MLTSKNVVKIADFGLAKGAGYYRMQSDIPLPLAWLAIETHKNYHFTVEVRKV